MSDSLHIPRHIAVVMDGNGRWAKKRHLPRLAGHKQGVEALRKILSSCHDLGVGALTVFAFSSENWKRPQDEVSGLLELMGLALTREIIEAHGGSISLSNREGGGLVVSLTLPRLAGAIPAGIASDPR